MRKKIILRLLLLGTIILFLHSCRIEDETIQHTKDPENRFAAFTSKDNEKVNYSKAFGYLYNRYYEIRDISAKNKNSGDPFYIDFRLHSQLMEFDNGDKAMLFAVINDHKVSGLMAGILEKEDTYLRYYYVAPSYDHYTYAVDAFQNALDKSSGINGKAIIGGSNGDDIEIPEIQIPPPRGGGVQYFPPQNGNGTCAGCPPTNDGAPGGDCPKFNGCGSSGGGGTGPNPTNNIDPCAKIKEKQNNPKYTEKFNALNKTDIFNMDKERGFYEKQPPLGVNTEAGFVQVDGPPGSTGLDLPDDTTGISGLFHSHNNVDGSIKIFSPTDVKTFINTFLKNAGTYGGGYANAYSTVVTSEGSYTIKYTGTAHPGGVDYYTAKSWGEWYEREMGAIQDSNGDISQDKVETVFTRFLQEVVNKPGLEVYKVTANTASKMTYNPTTKKADKVDCP